jgi:hypothetical protein
MTDPEYGHMLFVVVGAHLRAEAGDRPLAYKIVDAIEHWIEEHQSELSMDIHPVVCSDIWYVNHRELQQRPTISVGGPGVNALSAYYTQKLEAAFVRDEQMMIQLDPEYVDLRCSVWGMDHELTVQAVDLFIGDYLDRLLRAVATQVEPSAD